MAVAHAFRQVIEFPDAAGGDHWDRHGVGDGARQLEVEAVAGPVAVHGREQDFAGAEAGDFLGVLDGVEAGGVPPAVGEDLETGTLAAAVDAFGIDGDNDRLRSEFLRSFAHDFAPFDGAGVDGHLVGAGKQQRTHVGDRAHAAADRDRHEALLGGARHHVENDAALLVAGGDV